ncbi:MAG: hypothetical protein ABID83_01785 [Candidatus Omnitrophota bacterium]
MKYKAIALSLVIGMLLGSFLLPAEAEEVTPEQQEVMLQAFYNNNPIIIKHQQEKLKNILEFLKDNEIKYYRVPEDYQRYVEVENQVLYDVPTRAGGLHDVKVCVVRMNVHSDMPDDPMALYVFGDLSGNVYIDLPDSGYSLSERTVPIKGHTYYGRLNSKDDPYKATYVKTSIAMDSYGIASRITPVPNGTLLNETYLVPATSFRPGDVLQEFHRLVDLLNKLGPAEKPKKQPKRTYKEEFQRMITVGIGRMDKLKQLPNCQRVFEVMAQQKTLEPQAQEAKAQEDWARYNALVPQWNALLAERQKLDGTEQVLEYNRMYDLFDKFAVLYDSGTEQQMHDYLMQSGLGKELGYDPPKEE